MSKFSANYSTVLYSTVNVIEHLGKTHLQTVTLTDSFAAHISQELPQAAMTRKFDLILKPDTS